MADERDIANKGSPDEASKQSAKSERVLVMPPASENGSTGFAIKGKEPVRRARADSHIDTSNIAKVHLGPRDRVLKSNLVP